MRNAYSYIRFSTPDQLKGDSFRRQLEFSQKYAERNGLVLDKAFSIHDLGVSAFRGTNVKEGALAGFLESIRQKRVPKGSILIVESLDRLSRDQIRPALQLFLGILDAGVSIVTMKPEREYTPDDQDPLVLIEPLIYFSRAHEESLTKSSRNSESWEARRRKAASEKKPMTGHCPKWLRKEDDKFVVIPERAALVKRIFRMSREGMGTYAIAKKLNAEGTKSFGTDSGKNAGLWNTAYVRMILTDKRAAGLCQPKKMVGGQLVNYGDPIDGYYPAVVTEAEFYSALGGMKSRKKQPGRGGSSHDNIFSGLVFNAVDGFKMHHHLQRQSPLLESSAGHYRQQLPRASFSYNYFESTVLSVLEELKPSELTGATDGEASKERLEQVRGELEEVKGKLAKANEMAKKAKIIDTFLGLIEDLTVRQRRLADELELLQTTEAEGSDDNRGSLKSIITMKREATGDGRERLNRVLRDKAVDIISEIWILVEPIHRKKKIAHIQIFLKNGERKYGKSYYPDANIRPSKRTDYATVDLRNHRSGGMT